MGKIFFKRIQMRKNFLRNLRLRPWLAALGYHAFMPTRMQFVPPSQRSGHVAAHPFPPARRRAAYVPHCHHCPIQPVLPPKLLESFPLPYCLEILILYII